MRTSWLPPALPALEWLLVFAITLGIALRFIYLDVIPAALSHDEIFYVTQARMLAAGSNGTTGQWSPLSFTSEHPLFAELPGVIMTPAAWLLTSPLLAARITHAIFGSGVVILLGLVAFELFKDRRMALFVSLGASYNPWLFQVSRMTFDSLLSIFFLLGGCYLLLQLKDWYKLLAFPLLLLGFFQYQGMKVVLLPLVGLLSLYILRTTDTSKWKKVIPSLSLLLLLCLSITLWFAATLSSQSARTRSSDLLFNAGPKLAGTVDAWRTASLPSKLQPVFSNKLTAALQLSLDRYFETFSASQLFITGDPSRTPTSVWSMGIFYPHDAVVLAIGFWWLWSHRSRRDQALLITSLMLLGPLPSALNTQASWVFLRSSFTFPILSLVAGIGMWYLWDRIVKHWMLKAIVLAIVIGFTSWFMHEYFYRYPVYATRGSYFSERILAEYVQRVSTSYPEINSIVLADEAWFVFQPIVVYGTMITSETQSSIATAFATENYQHQNILVKTSCASQDMFVGHNIIITDSSVTTCSGDIPETAQSSFIASPYENTLGFTIYNDLLCNNYQVSTYSRITARSILDITQLSDEQFCKAFISKN